MSSPGNSSGLGSYPTAPTVIPFYPFSLLPDEDVARKIFIVVCICCGWIGFLVRGILDGVGRHLSGLTPDSYGISGGGQRKRAYLPDEYGALEDPMTQGMCGTRPVTLAQHRLQRRAYRPSPTTLPPSTGIFFDLQLLRVKGWLKPSVALARGSYLISRYGTLCHFIGLETMGLMPSEDCNASFQFVTITWMVSYLATSALFACRLVAMKKLCRGARSLANGSVFLWSLLLGSCVWLTVESSHARHVADTKYCQLTVTKMSYFSMISMAAVTIVYHSYSLLAMLYILTRANLISFSWPWRIFDHRSSSSTSSAPSLSKILARQGVISCCLCNALCISVIAILLSRGQAKVEVPVLTLLLALSNLLSCQCFQDLEIYLNCPVSPFEVNVGDLAEREAKGPPSNRSSGFGKIEAIHLQPLGPTNPVSDPVPAARASRFSDPTTSGQHSLHMKPSRNGFGPRRLLKRWTRSVYPLPVNPQASRSVDNANLTTADLAAIPRKPTQQRKTGRGTLLEIAAELARVAASPHQDGVLDDQPAPTGSPSPRRPHDYLDDIEDHSIRGTSTSTVDHRASRDIPLADLSIPAEAQLSTTSDVLSDSEAGLHSTVPSYQSASTFDATRPAAGTTFSSHVPSTGLTPPPWAATRSRRLSKQPTLSAPPRSPTSRSPRKIRSEKILRSRHPRGAYDRTDDDDEEDQDHRYLDTEDEEAHHQSSHEARERRRRRKQAVEKELWTSLRGSDR